MIDRLPSPEMVSEFYAKQRREKMHADMKKNVFGIRFRSRPCTGCITAARNRYHDHGKGGKM